MLLRGYFSVIVFVFLKIANISCSNGSTLAFAIDDTLSMKDDLIYVKNGAKRILDLVFSKKNSDIKDLVLVTFNDPVSDVDLKIKTSSVSIFLGYLNRIFAHNWRNPDCEEYSLSGIELALKESRPDSYIYVFTDANAKDYYKLNTIKNLCQQKQSQVVIIFSIAWDCYRPNEYMFNVYFEVAKACSGQVFIVQKQQIDSLLKTIEILLEGKTSIIKWTMVPKKWLPAKIQFSLDQKVEYAIISTTGSNVDLRVTSATRRSPDPALENITSTYNCKVIKLIHPKPGTYYAWVKGDSPVTIAVYGRTDLTFDHGFSVLRPKSMRDTSKQPIAGLKQYLSIQVNDPDHSFIIDSVQIVDIGITNRIFNKLVLRNIGRDLYITDAFVAPNCTFRIAIKGKINQNNEEIVRNSRTNIDPQFTSFIPRSYPVVKIIEGTKLSVNYGSEVTLTCEVTAHPAPTIKWYTSRYKLLASESSVVDVPRFISYLKLKNITHSEAYICGASNRNGRGKDMKIQIQVRPVFTHTYKSTETISNVKYGETLIISCNFKSYLPIKFKWYRYGKEIRDNTTDYFLSSNGCELTVKFMNIDKQGKYTCEAILNSDPRVKETHSTVFKIKQGSPVIQPKYNHIHVRKADKLELKCKIVQGYPNPQIKWFKKVAGVYVLLPYKNSDVLTVNSALLTHAGHYKCEATNYMGTDTAVIDVSVSGLPEVSVTNANKEVPYDNDVELECEVESYLQPNIVWKNDKGLVLQSKFTHTSDYQYRNVLKLTNVKKNAVYICMATNNLGSDFRKVTITVLSAFEVRKHIQGTISVNYGSDKTLNCDIKSTKPMTIQWYREKTGVKSSKIYLTSSNKYTISGDNTELTIHSVDLDVSGKYTCLASLLSDPTEKVAYSVEINVIDTIPQSKPVINIDQGSELEVNYGSELSLTCKVTAHPAPKIEWYTSGTLLSSESPVSKDPLFVRTLKLKNIKENQTYVCKASNINGKGIDGEIQVKVRPVFTVLSKPTRAVFNASYGEAAQIPCNIKSYLPIRRKWYRSGQELSGDSDIYYVSPDGTELTLKSINLETQGKYTCVATLNADPTVKTNYITDVKILGLALPKIEATNKNINVSKADKIELKCKIARGHPKPQIKWYKKNGNSYLPLPEVNGEVLTVNKASLTHAGQYKCQVTNELGHDTATFDVTVTSLPEITIIETNKEIAYDGNVELTCKVKSYPPPSIVWKDGSGSIIQTKVNHTSAFDFYNEIQLNNIRKSAVYMCEASNNIGTATEEVNVTVLSPFEVKKHIQGEIAGNYGNSETLICDVKSTIPLRIQWYRERQGVKSSRALIETSDKYTISEDRSKLTINSLDIDMAGKYICVPSLLSDPTEKVTYSVDVKVVDPIPQSKPDVKINEGSKLDVSYGSKVSLTCNVTAHPAPEIEWYTSGGDILSSESSIVSDPLFVSYLKLQNIKQTETFVCKASNRNGKEKSMIRVQVRPVFTSMTNFKDTVSNAKYGDAVNIPCNINSYLPIKIKWYRSGRELTGDSGAYSVSPDRTTLTIKSVNIEKQGKYTCEASIASDSTVKKTHNTDVKIPGLAVPEIESTNRNLTVSKADKIELKCKIARGYPEPLIKWYKKNNNTSSYMPLPEVNGEVLTVNKASLTHAGQYKCEVTNELGHDTATFDVTVTSLPEISVTKTNKEITYDGNVAMTCKVESYPPPSIVWKDASGSVVQTKVNHSSAFNFYNELKLNNLRKSAVYMCEASNTIGSVSEEVEVTVLSPFEVKKHIQGKIGANYGSSETLLCDIKSTRPLRIQWYRERQGVKSSRALIKPSNKYTISEDSCELTINSIDSDMAGKYICEAYLLSDPTEKVTYSVDVEVIDPIPQSKPDVKINEGSKLDVNYGSEVSLTCNVTAHPAPEIEWYTSGGDILSSESSVVADPLFVSNLKLENIKQTDTYLCTASNRNGKEESRIQVQVRPVFTSVTNFRDNVFNAKYGDAVNIPCNINSYLPIKIKWFRSGRELTGDSGAYSISPDGTTLTIKSVNIEKQGKYTCEASIASDSTAKKTHNTDVKIPGLAVPEIESTNRNITVSKADKIELKCKIARGYPEPLIKWYKKNNITSSYMPLSEENGEVLTVNKASLTHAGQYKCEVTNELGHDTATFDVTVTSLPEISVTKTNKEITYDGNVAMTCKVESYPPPSIVWKDASGSVVQTKVNHTSAFNFYNELKLNNLRKSAVYMCEASNNIESVSEEVEVTVLSPFEVKKHIQGKISTNYRSSETLLCDIKSTRPLRIQWYRERQGVKSSRALIKPSNKYTISEDNSELTINSIDLDMAGKYICEAYLLSDPTEKVTYSIDVEVIDPIPQSKPDVKINEGSKLDVNYGSEVSLTCNVTAHPAPEIEWYTLGGDILSSESSVVADPFFVSNLKLENIKQTDTYVCTASNRNGKEESRIQVQVRPIFTSVTNFRDNVFNAKYGDDVNIPCNINSYLPIKIKWFRSGRELTGDSGAYSISPDGTTLTIKSVNIEKQGKYTCEASIASDSTAKKTHNTDVKIPGLAVPEIESTNRNITVSKADKIELKCKIARGYPEPLIKWYKKNNITSSYMPLSEVNGEVLTVNKASLTHAGQYKCEVTNELGHDTETFDVTVSSLPEISVTKTNKEIAYDGNVAMTCKVESYPPPSIVWKDASGSVVQTKVNHTSAFNFYNELKLNNIRKSAVYMCEASNTIGSVSEEVEVTVLSPFEVKKHIQGKIGTNYGSSETLLCDIKSTRPLRIQWYRERQGVKSSRALIKPSNKYTISEDSCELTINSIDLDMAGKYICEASLLSDPTEKVTYSIDVEVIDPIPQSKPDVKINEGSKLDVNHGSEVSMTCNVTAHPAPEIEWYTLGGDILSSESSIVSDPLFISNVKLENIKQTETYICKASNRNGKEESRIQVQIRPVFTSVTDFKDINVNAKYGDAVNISCNINSYLPIKIKWYRSGRELTGHSGAYSVSPDGTALTIQFMNIEKQGKYTCEAALESDSTVKQTQNTAVKIPGLARPEIKSINKNISGSKGNNIELKCKITQGYPKPEIKWLKKNGNSYTPLSDVSSEVFTINNTKLTHGGQYKCEASNEMGTDVAIFDVTVTSLPEISITKTNKEVPYDSDVELTCNVKSYPPPNIVWKDINGTVLRNKANRTSEYTYYNQLILENVKRSTMYICEAKNEVGSNSEDVNITVLSPFEVKKHIEGPIGINYGRNESLRCEIESTKPITIRWYRQNSDVKSSRSLINSSDKFIITDGGVSLTILFVDVNEVGKYTCEASLLSDPVEKVAYSADVHVIGLNPPEITSNSTVLDGKNFTAICRIQGAPKPIISWKFKPKGSQEFKTIAGSGEELNIAESTLKDSGIYKCIGENSLGETYHDFVVDIEDRPIIHNEESVLYGVEGDLVIKIICNVTGFPEPTIGWKINGEPLNMSSKYVADGSILYIKEPTVNDIADYTCEAVNILGNATKSFEVIVVEDLLDNDIDVYGVIHEIYAERDKPKTIKCNLKYETETSVRWYLDGSLAEQKGSSYVIDETTDDDARNYTCRVNSNEGSNSESYVLYVGSAPYVDNPSPKTIYWESHHELDCTVADADPPAKYEWTHNNKQMSGKDLNKIPITDWGEYTCNASNILGSTQIKFNVVTSGCFIANYTQNQALVTHIENPTWPASTSNNGIFLKVNEEIKLLCLNNTFMAIPSKNEVAAKCISQDKFTVDGNTYKYSELQCNTRIEPSVVNTGNRCSGPNSEIIRVRFEIKNSFLDAYKVCYDINQNVPIYAKALARNILNKKDIVDSTKFEWSSVPNLSSPQSGNWTTERNCKCCYTQEQLVNVNEMAFGPAQAATFKDNLNSVPIWNSCEDHRVSWQSFDRDSRENSFAEKWPSWTGASTYENKDGGLIPRFVWKVVNTGDDVKIMVYVNDKSPRSDDIRCSTSCNEAQIFLGDQFLYCCTLEEFSQQFEVSTETFNAST